MIQSIAPVLTMAVVNENKAPTSRIRSNGVSSR